MGYTHYWRRQEKIEQSDFNSIVVDFKKILPELQKILSLGDGIGNGEPIINTGEVIFNGAKHCGHKPDEEVTIPWPTDNAGGIANNWQEDAKSGRWFAGALLQKRACDGDCSYETFMFQRVMKIEQWQNPESGLYFDCCKTAFRPYDWAVISFLIIAKHHLKDKIKISSDGEDGHWFDGKILCQTILNYGLDFQI